MPVADFFLRVAYLHFLHVFISIEDMTLSKTENFPMSLSYIPVREKQIVDNKEMKKNVKTKTNQIMLTAMQRIKIG